MKQLTRKILITLSLLLISCITLSEGYNGELIAPNRRVTVDYQRAELVSVLRSLSFDNDLNMVINDNVQGTVSLSVTRALVDDLLEAILRMNGYTYFKSGDLVEIVALDEAESLSTIDKPVSRTYTLKNVSVTEIEEDILSLLKETDTLIMDEDTNSITIRAKKSETLSVEKYINIKDGQKVITTRKNVELIRMNHLSSVDLYEILKDMDYRITGDIKVSEILNGLIVTASSNEVELLKEVISKLDSPEHQVVIEARIIEVQEGDGKDWGVSWNYNGDRDNDNRTGESETAIIGSKEYFNFTPSTGLSLGLGLLGNDQFTAVYRNIVTNTSSEVLAKPTLTTLSGKTSRIDIVDEVPYKQLEYISDSGDGTSSSYEFKETGITLEVTPIVSEDGMIRMEVAPTISEITGYTDDGIPITSTRSVETNVIVRNGETLAIGGLIRNKTSLTDTEDPILSRIPILGNLFKTSVRDDDKTNLMIFITPKIILSRELQESINLIIGEESIGSKKLKELEKEVTNSYKENIITEETTEVKTGINRIQDKLQNVIY